MYNFTNYPAELRKKVTLLKHFKHYLLVNNDAKRDNTTQQATFGESTIGMTAKNYGLPVGNGVPTGSPTAAGAATGAVAASASSSNSSGAVRPYVKKWMKNRNAIMFQLSNKIVHVIFFDRAEIVLSH